MQRKTLRGIIVFLSVLIITVVLITALSFFSKQHLLHINQTEPEQEIYVEAPTMSAVIPEDSAFPYKSVGAFLLIALLPAGFIYVIYKRNNGKIDSTGETVRRYDPKSEIAFQSTINRPYHRSYTERKKIR